MKTAREWVIEQEETDLDDVVKALEARDAEWRLALNTATAALEGIASSGCRLPPGGMDCRHGTTGEMSCWCDHQTARRALTEISKLLASQPTGEAGR